jgi:hypothetical protein
VHSEELARLFRLTFIETSVKTFADSFYLTILLKAGKPGAWHFCPIFLLLIASDKKRLIRFFYEMTRKF